MDMLKELADSPNDYERQGGTVLFVRHGREYSLTLKDIAGLGLTVEMKNASGSGVEYEPLMVYIQKQILDLPRLSRLITKAIESSLRNRPGRYVDGPGQFDTGSTSVRWESVKPEFEKYLKISEPGTTKLIQLMAPAGQGKTMLIEQAALEFSKDYRPDVNPSPLVLPVDLLGRYVGNVDDAIAGSLT